MRAVDPEYFSLMRIQVLAGRTFTPADDEHAPKVAVVSEAYGRSLFGDASPIGRRLEMRDALAEIVGVVGDVRHAQVKAAPFPGLYLPRAQEPTWLICLLIRPAAGAQGVAASARAVIQSIDPEQPVQHITTLDRIVRESTADERFYAITVAGFALVAVLLAMAGVAASSRGTSPSVSARSRFGSRLARSPVAFGAWPSARAWCPWHWAFVQGCSAVGTCRGCWSASCSRFRRSTIRLYRRRRFARCRRSTGLLRSRASRDPR